MQSLDWEKDQKRRQNEPENPPRKLGTRKGKIERGRRKKGGEGEKKAMVALLVFMLTSLEIVFERKKLFEGRALIWL